MQNVESNPSIDRCRSPISLNLEQSHCTVPAVEAHPHRFTSPLQHESQVIFDSKRAYWIRTESFPNPEKSLTAVVRPSRQLCQWRVFSPHSLYVHRKCWFEKKRLNWLAGVTACMLATAHSHRRAG